MTDPDRPDALNSLRAALAAYAAEHGSDADAAAELLADLGDLHGGGAIKQAARVLRGERGGRPALDDAALLAEIRKLIATSGARSRWHACGAVAKQHAK